MAHYLPMLDTTLMIGVGAAFLFHTGAIRDSPKWVKQSGLQWLHRLSQEPARLWKRYLLNNPVFVLYAFLQMIGWKHYALETDTLGSSSHAS
jgi:N-acetylglucosaminyldiphosphoundecaprenol N-acetyl-beta-D-mannosaminyltransferase